MHVVYSNWQQTPLTPYCWDQMMYMSVRFSSLFQHLPATVNRDIKTERGELQRNSWWLVIYRLFVVGQLRVWLLFPSLERLLPCPEPGTQRHLHIHCWFVSPSLTSCWIWWCWMTTALSHLFHYEPWPLWENTIQIECCMLYAVCVSCAIHKSKE